MRRVGGSLKGTLLKYMSYQYISLGLAHSLRPDVIAMSGNITDMMATNVNYPTSTEKTAKMAALTTAREAEVAGAANILSLESQLAVARATQLVLEGAHD